MRNSKGFKYMKTARQSKVEKRAPIARGTGRRKKAVARIWLRPGKGSIIVNGKVLGDYFDTAITRLDAATALRVTDMTSMYDVEANVAGGGRVAQAGAVRLGIARALVNANDSLKPTLRVSGLLTVDARNKERKKYGQRGARRKFQFVKR